MNQEKLKNQFESRGFKTSFFKTKEEAKDYLANQIKQTVVGFGGSMTLKEMDLFSELSKNNLVLWHWQNPGVETLKLARLAKVYVSSVNGLSETGEIVNIDRTGNRIEMLCFGPSIVYLVVGQNKIEPTLDKAIWRSKNVAAPLNAKRLKLDIPCAKVEKCLDCNSPKCIRGGMLILDRPMSGMVVEIVFVEENLGY